ncbi:MAG TPA: Wzz/FepE/Etk N-terminal domain-containing protein [Vicinamibacterales bacterium]|nr:Wzz/FepE/Etk N-terminal domain-containing protein [Vicinamibacterales bacterium]
MLPGKKYQPEDFLRIAWTRKWFIVVPTILIGAAVFAWSSTLPNRYRSTATILVVPQRVPEAYVRAAVTASVTERLQTISQQILSRTRLERVIEDFNLYQEERKTMILEDVVELMRRDVKVDTARTRRREDTSHFTVGFDSPQPRTAMQVAERLASMFVQENLQDREILADSTNQFLQAQLEDARRRLTEHETTLEAFRLRNSGQLPTQVQSNMHMLQVTQTQLQANVDASNRERDRLLVLDGAIAEAVASLANRGSDQKGAPATLAQQIETARASLKGLEDRFKDSHPDVRQAKRQLADLEAKAAAKGTPGAATPASAMNASAVAGQLSKMRMEAEQLRKSIETRKAEHERLRKNLAAYTARLEATPKLESEMAALTRDYDTIKTQYETLLKKSEESKIAVNLERRQIGEQFKVIDGARLPERPISPNRLRLNLIGVLAGLGLGVVLVGLLEYRDTSLKTDDDIVTSLALPVLAVIPVMRTEMEYRRAKRKRVLLAVSASVATILLAVAVAVWQPDLLQTWMR